MEFLVQLEDKVNYQVFCFNPVHNDEKIVFETIFIILEGGFEEDSRDVATISSQEISLKKHFKGSLYTKFA
jgi:hypothetical protein